MFLPILDSLEPIGPILKMFLPILDSLEPIGPILKGITYIVLPAIQPGKSS